MHEEEQNTLNLLLSAAMEEFLKKGFRGASLRGIVKAAGGLRQVFPTYRHYPGVNLHNIY